MAATFLTATQSSTGDTLGVTNSTAIPASTAANDVVILFVTVDKDVTSGIATVTWPSGFTEVTGSPFIVIGPDFTHYHIAWKRSVSGEGSGSYGLTFSFNCWTLVHAFAVRGTVTTGDPYEDIQQSVTTASTTVPNITVTTTASDLLVFLGVGDQATGPMDWSPPTGPATFTEVIDNDYDEIAWLADTTSGSRTVSGATMSTAQTHGQMVMAFPPATGGATVNPTRARALNRAPIIRASTF